MTKPSFDTQIEYLTENDIPYLVLPMDFKKEETLNCPFCGYKHHHGNVNDGHRNAHCKPNLVKNEYVVHADGTKLFQSNGYFLKFINESQTMKTQNILEELYNKIFSLSVIEEHEIKKLFNEINETDEKIRAKTIEQLRSYFERENIDSKARIEKMIKELIDSKVL